jgi:Flp pilus assembly protein TadD
MTDAAAWLHEGNFERARKRFQEAIALDPGLPEAFNGVGVTYRMRNDLAAAVAWYKKALAVDPDFGDAYYNMACVYALQGQEELALRYLQIAAMNGYATAEGIDQDPDLEPLRATPAYRALVKARL